MKLDAAALRALNIFPPTPSSAKTHSLYGLLNHCKTAQGQRLLSQWLKQPLLDLARITERHDVVEAFTDDDSLRSSCVRNIVDNSSCAFDHNA
jgi:DNA mismatch repair ATPase MutS